MGQVISRLSEKFDDMKIAAGFDIYDSGKNPYPVFSNLDYCNLKLDIIIDFSKPDALDTILKFAILKKLPIVVATTGISQSQRNLMEETAKTIPVFFSANMSLGINLLLDLVKKAAKILAANFDIEIIEKHHNQKLDAPSGTALAIADSINSILEQKQEYIYDRHSRRKKRSKSEIGIHAIRGGTIVGEHSVVFAGNDEIIEINHSAMSKDIFGAGALRAARFICKKTAGLYSMSDLLSEE